MSPVALYFFNMSGRKCKIAYVAHSIFLLDCTALHILEGPSWLQNYILPQNDPQVWTSDDSSWYHG